MQRPVKALFVCKDSINRLHLTRQAQDIVKSFTKHCLTNINPDSFQAIALDSPESLRQFINANKEELRSSNSALLVVSEQEGRNPRVEPVLSDMRPCKQMEGIPEILETLLGAVDFLSVNFPLGFPRVTTSEDKDLDPATSTIRLNGIDHGETITLGRPLDIPKLGEPHKQLVQVFKLFDHLIRSQV
jgi:hypothetical protein